MYLTHSHLSETTLEGPLPEKEKNTNLCPKLWKPPATPKKAVLKIFSDPVSTDHWPVSPTYLKVQSALSASSITTVLLTLKGKTPSKPFSRHSTSPRMPPSGCSAIAWEPRVWGRQCQTRTRCGSRASKPVLNPRLTLYSSVTLGNLQSWPKGSFRVFCNI